MIKITVKDTGIGMNEQKLDKVRKAVYQMMDQQEYLDTDVGINIGLKLSNKLAKQLNDERLGIHITSDEHVGTNVKFYVQNIVPQGEKANWTQFLSEGRNLPSLRPIPSLIKGVYASQLQGCECSHILIVDDDEFNILTLKALINLVFPKITAVDKANNGQQAITACIDRTSSSKSCENENCQGYKLILMDCNMPVMDGFKASQQIKSMVKDGTMNDMIIIACTAIPDDAELQRKIREHKMDDYIPKPILKSQLKNTIFKYYKMVHGSILCPIYWT